MILSGVQIVCFFHTGVSRFNFLISDSIDYHGIKDWNSLQEDGVKM